MNNFETINCDLCGSNDSEIIYKNLVDNYLFKPGLFNYVRCQNCGQIYLNPRPLKTAIPGYYKGEYIPYGARNFFIMFLKKILWLPDKLFIDSTLTKGGKILEIGCARGDFLAYLGKRYQTYGLEMDQASVDWAVNKHGLDVSKDILEDHDFGGLKFDFVIMFFVLEHMLSPKRALGKLYSIMNPGGVALISLPNFNSWERRFFGRYWAGFDVPRHLYIFGEPQFKRLAEEAGFEILKVKYSLVPNDWLASIKRLLTEKGFLRLAKIFSIYNLFLAALFLPISFIAKFSGQTTRFSFVIRRI